MDENELKAKLAEMDAAIAKKQGEVEDMRLDLRHLAAKREAFARRNCKHERTYQRSCMGETNTYCDICKEAL